MNESTLGKRISYHRKRLSLTQEQLAERVGVSAQAVSKWGKRPFLPGHQSAAAARGHFRHHGR